MKDNDFATVSTPHLVSVGVPAYNRPEGLLHTLECLTAQTYQNLEIIVSDNASPGSEVEHVVRSFSEKDCRIKYFKQPINIGASANFKFVLDQANGEYFVWFSDDDSCENTFIGELVSCLNLHPDVVLAMSDVRAVNDTTSQVSDVRLSSISISDCNNNWHFVRKLFFAYPTSNIFFCIYGLYRTENLKQIKINFVSKWKGISFATEVPFLAQMALQGRIVSIPKTLKTYLSHNDSIYIKEMARINRFDRFVRHIEILISLTLIAVRYGKTWNEKIVLGGYPWTLQVSRITRKLFGNGDNK